MEVKPIYVTLAFPKLNNALMKNTKEMRDDDPRRGILVLNNQAIVLNRDFCLVVDLYDYFTLDCEVNDEMELVELKKILYYMNGKIFGQEFWGELTGGANMRMNNGLLFIETPKYSKDLHYKDMPIQMLPALDKLQKLISQPEQLVGSVAIPFGALHTIYSTLAKDFKVDDIIFELTSQDQPVKFTFRERKWFYGFLMPNYNAAQEGFRFETLDNFINDGDIQELIEELRKEQAPPPPPVEVAEVEDNNEPDLFGGNINTGKTWTRGSNMKVVKPEDDE